MIAAMVQKESFLQTLFIYNFDYKWKTEIINSPKMFLYFYPTA